MGDVKVDDKQVKLAQDADLDALLKLLRHEDSKIRELAAKVINSLERNDDDDVCIQTKDGFLPLVDLATQDDEDVQAKAVWALAILASSEANQAPIVQQVGWPIVMGLIRDGAVEVQCGAVTLLGNLALADDTQQKIIEIGAVGVLLKLLDTTRDIIVKRAVVTALSNIIEADNAGQVVHDGALEQLVGLLSQADDERLLLGVVHTISNIANADDTRLKRKVVTRGALPRLVALLESRDEMIHKGSAMALSGLSALEENHHAMVDARAVEAMLRLLRGAGASDDELALGIVMGLNNMAHNPRFRSTLVERGVVDAISDVFLATRDDDVKREITESLQLLAPDMMPEANGGSRRSRSPPRQARRRRSPRRRNSEPEENSIRANVQKIISVLIEDESNQDKLRGSGVISPLLTLLQNDNDDLELKGLAFDALTMLAVNNPENQAAIADGTMQDGMALIIAVIKNKTAPAPLLARAVRTLGAVCWHNKRLQDRAHSMEVLAELVSQFESYDSPLRKAVFTTVAALTDENTANRLELTKAGADARLAHIIGGFNLHQPLGAPVLAAAAAALAALAKQNPKVQRVGFEAIGTLVQAVELGSQLGNRTREDDVLLEHATGALLELARGSRRNADAMWNASIVDAMAELLHSAASEVLLYNAAALVWELAKHPQHNRVMRRDIRLNAALAALSRSRSPLVREATTRVISVLN